MFTKNSRDSYHPSKYLTVDEMLLNYQGRCSFRMYIPSKASKFGIKIFCAVDPKTMYLVNSSVYLGKQSSKSETGLGEQVIMFFCSLLHFQFLGCKKSVCRIFECWTNSCH
jgi:hypothetical protein